MQLALPGIAGSEIFPTARCRCRPLLQDRETLAMSTNRLAPYWSTLPAAPTRRTTPLVSVVIVNFRRWSETANLVEQLLGPQGIFHGQFEIVVIDNHSPDDAAARRLRRTPGVRIYRMSRNRGFSAAVNEGMRRSRGRWLLVMNSDLAAAPEFVDQVCATALDFEAESIAGAPVGIVGFQLRNADGTPQLSTGAFPTLGRMLVGLLRRRAVRKYQRPRGVGRCRVPWVTGSCLLIRRACLRQLGGFDESFFLYYEDVDLCRRAQQCGWAVCYDPSVQAVHLDPLQNRRPTPAMRVITRHAALTYFAKHRPGAATRWLARIIRFEAWLRQKWAALRGRRLEALCCRKLRGIARDLQHGRADQARRRLQTVLDAASMAE